MSNPMWPMPGACRRTRRTLEARLDGRVPDSDNAAAAAHTAQCARCRAFERQITRADRVLARYAASLPPAPEFSITAPSPVRRQSSPRSLVPLAIAVGACGMAIVMAQPLLRGPSAVIPVYQPNRVALVAPAPVAAPSLQAGEQSAAIARPHFHRGPARAKPASGMMLAMNDRRRSAVHYRRAARHKPFLNRVMAAQPPAEQVADASAPSSDNVRITITDDVRGFTSTARLSGNSGSTQLLEVQADAPVSNSQ